jgi:IMP dehydrogenase
VTGPDGQRVKQYRGMASREVADEHHGGIAEWKTAEGVATSVPYREDEDAIMADLIGGLRSGLTYAGSKTVKELQRKLNYVVITSSGWRESMPHKLF